MEKNNQKQQTGRFVLNTLAASVLLISHSVYALEALDDNSLSNVNGQDGLHVT